MPDQVVIVGGVVAAMRCAFELRERGFDGHLSMLCAESTPPYDRTLVSKALISGEPVDPERLLMQSLEAYNDAGIELRLGSGRPRSRRRTGGSCSRMSRAWHTTGSCSRSAASRRGRRP